jgi:hypothetical protein
MANQKLLPEWVDARSSGQPITAELHVVGEDGVANEYFLNELPEPGTAVTIATRTQQAQGDTLAANDFTVDYKTGKVTTHASNDGEDVSVAYTAMGSTPLARDMDRLRAALGYWNIDVPPPIVNTPDDEFGATTKAGKWTAVAGAVGTVDPLGTSGGVWTMFPSQKIVAMQPSTTVAVLWRQDFTLPDNTAIVCKMTPGLTIDGQPGIVNNELNWGMWLNDTDTGPRDGDYVEMTVDTSTDGLRVFFDSEVSTGQATPSTQWPPGMPVYLRITKKGTTWHGAFSLDGIGWTSLSTVTQTTAMTNLWIGCLTSASIASIKPIGIFHWIRQGDDNNLFPF